MRPGLARRGRGCRCGSTSGLFKEDEQTLRILGELKDQRPIPFDEVPLDPND